MNSALEFAGYDVKHVWGEGSHNGKHPTAIFPDAMRWLWKDWPQPVTSGQSKNVFLKTILQPGENWQAVPGDYQSAGILAADREGDIVFRDVAGTKSWKMGPDGQLSAYTSLRESYAGLAFGPDGRVYVTDAGGA